MTSIDQLRDLMDGATEQQKPIFEAAIKALEAIEPEQESLLGRWATYTGDSPDIPRRVLITSCGWDADGCTSVAWPVAPDSDGPKHAAVDMGELTPDPATLTTEEDYRSAPVGTVAASATTVFIRELEDSDELCWGSSLAEAFSPGELAGTPLTVLRWGDGK